MRRKMTDKHWLVVGLGNPGSRYQDTRHNVGRATVELLAREGGSKFKMDRSQTMVARIKVGPPGSQVPLTLAYARSFMNVCGPAVAGLAAREKVAASNLLIVHDDLDLPAHALRLKLGGGSGGHNGLKSVSSALKSQDYARLRIGVGRPPGSMDPAAFVLAPIRGKQLEEWQVTYQQAADVIVSVVLQGFTKAQMELHSRDTR